MGFETYLLTKVILVLGLTENDLAAPNPRIKIRIETLSDLVFGLALSIGSLVLIGRSPKAART